MDLCHLLLYPPQGEKGPNRVAVVLSKQTLPQQALAKTLGLEQLRNQAAAARGAFRLTATSIGEDAGAGTTPYYPAWVIRSPARNPFRKQLLILLFRPFAVNSRYL
jgi:hypothetical protein